MKLKTNLHLHISDDPRDVIGYSLYDAVDRAAELGFGVLGLTCHGFFAWRQEYADYAASKGILLIPGIELALNGPTQFIGRHVVVLNCRKDIEKVRTLDELVEYKRNNPQIFILAPHPYNHHPLEKMSLFEHLRNYINLFDAIEFSWFYSRFINRANRRAERMAQKYKKPFIATSDTHFLERLDFSYAVVDANEKSVGSVLQAIVERRFRNISSPRKFWREMMGDYVIKKLVIGDLLGKRLRIKR